jgi:hypothetical protein
MEISNREPQAVDYLKEALDRHEARRHDNAITAFEKVLALEPTGPFADLSRTFISKLSKTN